MPLIQQSKPMTDGKKIAGLIASAAVQGDFDIDSVVYSAATEKWTITATDVATGTVTHAVEVYNAGYITSDSGTTKYAFSDYQGIILELFGLRFVAL